MKFQIEEQVNDVLVFVSRSCEVYRRPDGTRYEIKVKVERKVKEDFHQNYEN